MPTRIRNSDTDTDTDTDSDTDADTDTDTDPLTDCADLDDKVVLDVVYKGPRIPAGYYEDPLAYKEIVQWDKGCANDLAEAEKAAALYYSSSSTFKITKESSATEYHQIDVVTDFYDAHYRITRCDWFDGTQLAGGPFTDASALGYLASYLWFVDNFNMGGSTIPAIIEDASKTDLRADVCWTTTVYGDFGLCDEITLWDSSYTMDTSGDVTLPSGGKSLRVIPGECH